MRNLSTRAKTVYQRLLDHVSDRWAKFVDDDDFPYAPPELRCWEWTGAMTPEHPRQPAQPKAKLMAQWVNPRRILFELLGWPGSMLPTRIITLCGNNRCVNPRHCRNFVPVEFSPTSVSYDNVIVEPNETSWLEDLFERWTRLGLTIDTPDPKALLRYHGENPTVIDKHLDDYLSSRRSPCPSS